MCSQAFLHLTSVHTAVSQDSDVDLGSIKKRDAAFDCFAYKSNHLLLVCSRAISTAHSHAAGPYPPLIPMQPSPMAETSRLLFPSLRFCIVPLKLKPGHFIHKSILASWYCSSLTFIKSTVFP